MRKRSSRRRGRHGDRPDFAKLAARLVRVRVVNFERRRDGGDADFTIEPRQKIIRAIRGAGGDFQNAVLLHETNSLRVKADQDIRDEAMVGARG